MSESVLGPKSPCCAGKRLVIRSWPTLMTSRQKYFCECGAHYTRGQPPRSTEEPTAMTYGDPRDLAVIDAYMRTAATRAVADAIRAAQPQLALLDGHGEPPALSVPGRNLYDASIYPDEMRQVVAPEQQFSRERVQHVTVRPVEGEPRVDRPDWLQRNWPKLVAWLAVAAAAGIGLWLLILAIAAALAALSAALTALLPTLGVIAVVLLLLGLCCRGGSSGGGGFSGTVQGRWWHG